MKLLLDMNLSPRWAEFLTGHGIQATHWSALGRANATDTAIMDYARANDFVVLTHDLDFSAILAATHGDRPSVIQLRADNISPESIGANVVSALHQFHTELEQGCLLTVDLHRLRVKMLPLRIRP